MRDTEQIVSPVVEAWATYRTTSAGDWPARRLLRAKGCSRVSVVLPARNEEATVGAIVSTIREHLMDRLPLVDELIVVDSRSTDRTAQVARAAGAEVVSQDAMTRGLPQLTGKGDALWAGLAAAEGDVVAFVDADLREFRPHFVTGLIGPLLTDPSVDFVKGFYHRPLVGATGVEADGGGRVTELMARPLLNLFWPELAGFVQPLAGEYAGRREVLEQVPFVSGYGVETAMLIDLLELVGLDALAQVDLGERKHRHQDTAALGRMSAQIMLTAWSRLQRRGWAGPGTTPAALLTQFRRGGSEALPNLDREIVVSDVSIEERPPLAQLRHRVPRRRVAA
ncbi:glucosyl-3-phosphoglycerate synthase [Micromonospora sp. 4G57]|uniref:Glucosyl-3-phosphoglycerate synthase n=1 Tax=Micromonospora sicca TaxID=2202420 RepID=A0A317DPD3_9ACTN|nr:MULTISPECIES: glucosyl-3-phosphoglycerate synthase [unclassified Micromonospora]MBM0227104.1 glucosyl-3-phosphoglycerate synthase [Micromonospora sp. ATA51]MDZ5446145.1 glucosyl-3-phosphoglycerate synthase [Micromonospora sp. 4G57]MDZ5491971.1 glucosyl-3-phosphoglycerate synthase [Micromonospora sp. 4G53]PWR16204.1 glucosyl-3-phosphoglycerate synthase [Micromonospora sp. 4G51]